ncbi:virginiamycin B lyase family protein [Pseudidiomarina woesei]|uniref:Streptogramin lyase n=1 Tax=Pseudidiomarina woesei TaxID=1381080 RepID=A0A0K6H6A4_9GAMM|nr:hypothetical protein [Pseudidiomarina woesei]CUA86256.1 Streptogramin lyase [Pseudidiomarina woesei]
MLAMTFALMMAGDAAANATLDITEWQVPWENSRPRDPYVAAPDEVWFVGQRADYAAVLNPETGEFERIDLPKGAGPHNIIVDERGAWYAGNKGAHIGKIDRETYEITQYPLPGDGRRDVHTMEFDFNGDIFFSAQGANQIGHMDAKTQEITLWNVPTKNARPYGLVVFQGKPWATLFGSNKLVTLTDNKEIQEIELPRKNANRPRRIGVDAQGHFWYVDYAGGYLGRWNPATDEVNEWPMPAGVRSMPYAMAIDHRGYVWAAETGVQPNRIVGFDSVSETFTKAFEVESGGGTIRHMVFDPQSQALWFGTDANTIGRATIRYY